MMMLVDWCRGKKGKEVEGKGTGSGEGKDLPPLEEKEGLR